MSVGAIARSKARTVRGVVEHHSNSRRFVCKCGRTHIWGHYGGYLAALYVPCNAVQCKHCRERHRRGRHVPAGAEFALSEGTT